MIDRQAIQKILRRLMAGSPTPARATAPRLPEHKAGLPKLVCLDSNKWIELARAHYGGGEDRAKAALPLLREAIADGRVVVPVAATNAVELMETRDLGRRQRLATFMVELSGNRSMLHGPDLKRAELRRATFEQVLELAAPEALRSRLIHWGMSAAARGCDLVVATGSEKYDALVNACLQEPELSVAMLIEALTTDAVAEGRSVDWEGLDLLSGVRAIDGHLSVEERWRVEAPNVFSSGSEAELLAQALEEMLVPPDAMRVWLGVPENALSFIRATPHLFVPGSLMFARDRNPDHSNHRNDIKDLSFLATAIPYANVVVTEKSWAHLANSTGLSDQYGTLVISDLGHLEKVLENLGSA